MGTKNNSHTVGNERGLDVQFTRILQGFSRILLACARKFSGLSREPQMRKSEPRSGNEATVRVRPRPPYFS